MLPDPEETIVALSSAPGPGARAIVRLSGSGALRCALTLFQSTEEDLRPLLPSPHAGDAGKTGATSPLEKGAGRRGIGSSVEGGERQMCFPSPPLRGRGAGVGGRRCYPGALRLPEVHAALPAELHFWPAPATYTGQELVELHTLSSPPLVELLIAQLLNAGARAAQPGEFTMRAFLAGKLDLTRAEAVLAIIEASSRQELRHALAQQAGGVAMPLQQLRDDLLNLLADVEAGLDFAEEDLKFVDTTQLLQQLTKGLAQLELLRKQLDQRTVSARPFCVALVGRPNAGKSSLFNALTGSPAALVSAEPGTTRDYLVRRVQYDDVPLEILDTAGWQAAAGTIDEQAQALGREQAEGADLLLLCLAVGQPENEEEKQLLIRAGAPAVLGVTTKCDLAPPPAERLATSAVTGLGVQALRTLLAERARNHTRPALAPSLSRCRHHVEACLDHLRQAHEAVLFEEPAEVLALQLRAALDELGEMTGAIYTDDLLDRIFSRFCIGK